MIVPGGNAVPPALRRAIEERGPSASPAAGGRAPIASIASVVDHTLLRADASQTQIETLCAEAIEYGFASVCVNAIWVPVAARALTGSDVSVCTVVGFPLGAMRSPIKALEAETARARGAREIDMVVNVGELIGGGADRVREDIATVRRVLSPDATLKVILETAFLSDDQKRLGARVAVEAGADFVKTSTGFGPGGATVPDVRLLAETVGERCRVKASGGIRTLAAARALVEAGAARIGASAGVAMAREERGLSTTTTIPSAPPPHGGY